MLADGKRLFLFCFFMVNHNERDYYNKGDKGKDTSIKQIKNPSKRLSKEGINLGLKAGDLIFFFFIYGILVLLCCL